MLQSMFSNSPSNTGGMTGAYSWMQQQQPNQRKTINSVAPTVTGTQTPTATTTPTGISGVTYNKPTGWIDEYGGNGELMGIPQWDQYFTGLENLGEGYAVEGISGQGSAGVGGDSPAGLA